MKILLINQPLNNRGDEAAHKALIRTLLVKIPNIQIKVLYVDCCSQEGLNQFKIPSLNVDYVNIKSFWWYSVIGPRSLINIKLTFAEIQQIAGLPIDHSFLEYKKELMDY